LSVDPNAGPAAERGSGLPGWAWLLVALVVAVALGTLAQRTFYGGAPERVRHFAGATMGTSWSLKASLPEGAPQAWVEAVHDTIQAKLDRVEGLMSTWDTTTELSRFNRSRDTLPHTLSDETIEVLSVAVEVGRESGGALDVTVAPLLAAWGFGPGTEPLARPPDPERLAALRRRVGLDRFRIDRRARTVAKSTADVVVDLSAVAKGYALDLAAAGVRRLGIADYALEVGGEVRAEGSRPDGAPWRAAVEAPIPGSRSVFRILELRGESVATSGDYRNFYVLDGVRYAHIIDPRTGAPVTWQGYSVTVVHREGVRADAWATALSVLGPEEGLRVAESKGLAVLFVTDVSGRLEARATRSMEARLSGQAD
jgi:thiamine biosynthesis lipoprotein